MIESNYYLVCFQKATGSKAALKQLFFARKKPIPLDEAARFRFASSSATPFHFLAARFRFASSRCMLSPNELEPTCFACYE